MSTKFKAGQSGNKSGRPKGRKNKSTLLREELENALPDVLEKLATSAKKGGYRHMKMYLDRVFPPLKSQDTPIQLRLRGSIEDKSQTVINAVSDGRITPDEGIKVMSLLMNQAKIIEVHELAERLEVIEQMVSNESN